MNISRWIFFPLMTAILMSVVGIVFLYLFVGIPFMKVILLIWFIAGLVVGFFYQIINELQTRKVSPQVSENEFAVNHTKHFALFCNYDEAFGLCSDFIRQKLKTKINISNILDVWLRQKQE